MFSSETMSRDFINSDFCQTQQQGSGLARYRSAPSSFLATLLDPDTDSTRNDDESEDMFSAFINGTPDLNQKNSSLTAQMQYAMKEEVEPEPRPGLMGFEGQINSAVVGSYTVGMDSSQVIPRGRNGNPSNLLRQSSSPAGFLNGFSVTGDAGNYKVQNRMNFSSGQSSRFMPSIPEAANESLDADNTTRLRNSGGSTNNAFSQDSWNIESPFNSLKRNRDGESKMFSSFNGMENQKGDSRKNPSGLVSHMSLPKTSSEMANVEKFLQFQPETSIPCQIRAKRGCATHPRSIAERVRRTKISEKMKKLQDLFPDLDKQANTSDMLELAVGYIKDLQKQVEILSETRAKCVCPNKTRESHFNT